MELFCSGLLPGWPASPSFVLIEKRGRERRAHFCLAGWDRQTGSIEGRLRQFLIFPSILLWSWTKREEEGRLKSLTTSPFFSLDKMPESLDFKGLGNAVVTIYRIRSIFYWHIFANDTSLLANHYNTLSANQALNCISLSSKFFSSGEDKIEQNNEGWEQGVPIVIVALEKELLLLLWVPVFSSSPLSQMVDGCMRSK